MKRFVTKLLIYLLLFITTCSFSFVSPQLSLAVTASNQVTTKVGNPSGPPPTSNSVQYALQLVQEIQAACGGVVNRSTVTCLQKIQPPLPQSVLTEITNSLSGFIALQCVGFVSAVLAGSTGQNLTIQNAYQDAYQYATSVPPGFTFIPNNGTNQIQPGDLPVWSAQKYPRFGHIAIVVSVNPSDPNSFTVANANFTGDGVVDVLPFTLNGGGLLGWLRQ